MPDELSFNPAKTAVLIMDYQVRQVNALPEAERGRIVRAASNVMDKARSRKIPVIFIEVVRGERTPENALYPGIAPKPGEPLLTKHRVGPFTTTNLQEILKKQGTETLVLMGINTGRVVVSTVACAADMDYKLIVLSDCCADSEPDIHRFLIDKLLPRWAAIATSQQFLEALDRMQ
jgi:nicotinamidase-related amidase